LNTQIRNLFEMERHQIHLTNNKESNKNRSSQNNQIRVSIRNNLDFTYNSNTGASGTLSNHNFNRMLEATNLNLQIFPLTFSITSTIIAGENKTK